MDQKLLNIQVCIIYFPSLSAKIQGYRKVTGTFGRGQVACLHYPVKGPGSFRLSLTNL